MTKDQHLMHHELELIRSIILACCQEWSAAQQRQHSDRHPDPSRLKVFLNGQSGLEDQIRAEIDFVEYVTDRRQADVEVHVTSAPGSRERREYTVAFTGYGRYEDIQAVAQIGVARGALSEEAAGMGECGRPDLVARDRRGAVGERSLVIA
jgi:hypothetical protein